MGIVMRGLPIAKVCLALGALLHHSVAPAAAQMNAELGDSSATMPGSLIGLVDDSAATPAPTPPAAPRATQAPSDSTPAPTKRINDRSGLALTGVLPRPPVSAAAPPGSNPTATGAPPEIPPTAQAAAKPVSLPALLQAVS